MTTNEDIAYEVTELRAEIARHHRDFAAIRVHLDWYDEFVLENPGMRDSAGVTLWTRIKGIVG